MTYSIFNWLQQSIFGCVGLLKYTDNANRLMQPKIDCATKNWVLQLIKNAMTKIAAATN